MNFEIQSVMKLPERKVFKIGDRYGYHETIKGFKLNLTSEPRIMVVVGSQTTINTYEVPLESL